MVADVGPVCPEYCRAAHGIPIGSWNKLLALARSGQLQAGMEWDTACEEMDSAALHDSRSEAAAKEETIEWWVLWLTLEDQMPNEPVIVHRVVVWDSVHELEYSEDMRWFGTTTPLSRSRWTSLRRDALTALSHEWFGTGEDGEPLTKLSLRERAKHSNFASCHDCAKNKRAWVSAADSGSRGSGVPRANCTMRPDRIADVWRVAAACGGRSCGVLRCWRLSASSSRSSRWMRSASLFPRRGPDCEDAKAPAAYGDRS